MTQYLNLKLKGGALARLTILRGMAAYTNAPDVLLPPSRRFADWRAARTATLCTDLESFGAGFNIKNVGSQHEKRFPVWYSTDGARFRDERPVHEFKELRMMHAGWYSDADCSRTICGIVARLPHGRWMAGYCDIDSGARVYLARVFGDLHDASQEADDEARRVAEDEKEYSERVQAAQDLDDQIATREGDIKELIPMRHHAHARRELVAAIDTLRTLRARRTNEYSDIDA